MDQKPGSQKGRLELFFGLCVNAVSKQEWKGGIANIKNKNK
jgi:hypothetical protein